MAESTHRAMESARSAPDLVASAADLLAGRIPPDEAIDLLVGLLDCTGVPHGKPREITRTPCVGDPRRGVRQDWPRPRLPADRPENNGPTASVMPSAPDATDQPWWHAHPMVVELRPDGWVVRSENSARVLGHLPDVARDHDPLSFVHPVDRARARRAFVETMTGRRTRCTVVIRVRAADGSLRMIEATFVAPASAVGSRSVVVYGLDMTAQHADLARLHEIVLRLSHGVMVVDDGGKVRLANHGLAGIFGARAEQWVNQHQGEALRAMVAACRDPALATQQLAVLARSPKPLAVRLQLVGGRIIHVDRAFVMEADPARCAVWQFWDIPAPPVVHASLATVLHELSAPLTAIASFADVLSSGRSAKRLSKEQRTATEAIARNTGRMLALVDDLLLLSQLENGQLCLRYGQVHVPELVSSALADRKAEAAMSGIVLTSRIGRGPALLGDEGRLHQVLQNLVRNAMKFSRRGARVAVSAAHDGTRWTIMVADRGCGIPAADLDRVTRGFVRGANAVAAGVPGSGLGLAICRRLVELHSGTLAIASTVGVGTTVSVTIPDRGRAR